MTSLPSPTPKASSRAFATEPPYVFQAGDTSFLSVKLQKMFDHVRNMSSSAAAGAVLSATDSLIKAGDFQHSESSVADAVGAIADSPHDGVFVQATLRLVRELRAAAAFRTDEPAPGSGDETIRPSKREIAPRKRPMIEFLCDSFVGVVRSLPRRLLSFFGGFFAPVLKWTVDALKHSSTRLLR